MSDHSSRFDQDPCVPRRERIAPILSMAQSLVDLRADLGDERACAEALSTRAFFESDIDDHLEEAIERARVIKSRGTIEFCIARDLICTAIFILAVLMWSMPARAASVASQCEATSGLRLLWSIVFAAGLAGVVVGVACIAWSRFSAGRSR